MAEEPFVPAAAWAMPFVALLLAIAVLPLAAPRFWASNLRKLAVAAVLALPVLLLYLQRHPAALLGTAGEFVSFVVLLGGLFVISGGVFLHGDLEATPWTNALFLASGALLASLIGTTGASMLLVRPLLQTNRERKHVAHTFVFFIFLVSNVGGCLTPLGDPPLFLGYLQGVPFLWTLRLLPAWAFTVGLLLVIYLVWDRRAHARESLADLRRDRVEVRPLRLAGRRNLVLLAGVVPAVAFLPAPWREAAIVALAAASFLLTPPAIRKANHFTFHPIVEVAALFAGLFVTMLPALDLLREHGARLGVRQPWHFFWATGALSSFLDNAPTYLAFLALGQGLHLAPQVAGVPRDILAAISLGAVFMGANTYVGNGPNFMVRSIAEERGVRMPSFGGYLLYSAAILLPVFVVVTLLFL
ncbi:MAG TPA: sodium:proton antiporter [Vicinamibacteria bacterium]|nr:sodium:proton antiporter [Vicinamibacteria bacterium]